MVVSRVVRRYVVQQLAKKSKPFIQRYVTSQYGEIAGFAVGTAISVGVGDYYGAFTGASDYIGDKPPGGRNPPFGYYPGGTVNGQTNGTFHKTLRTNQYFTNPRRGKIGHNPCVVCECGKQKRPKRNRRR